MSITDPPSKKGRKIFGIIFLILGILSMLILFIRPFNVVFFATGILLIIIGLFYLLQKKEPLDINKEMKKMDKQDVTLEKALKGKN